MFSERFKEIENEIERLDRCIMYELHRNLLRYGKIKADIECVEKDGYRRIRVFEYKKKKYFHIMFNGKVINIFEV